MLQTLPARFDYDPDTRFYSFTVENILYEMPFAMVLRCKRYIKESFVLETTEALSLWYNDLSTQELKIVRKTII